MMELTKFNRNQLEKLYKQHVTQGFFQAQKEQINDELLAAGAVTYDFWLPETHALPLIIHPNEHINGIVFGRYKQEEGHQVGRGALIATTDRVLLIDKKPLFIRCDEILYSIVNGVSLTSVGFAHTVILHSRMGDLSIRSFNQKCAESFVEAVEAEIFTQDVQENRYDYSP